MERRRPEAGQSGTARGRLAGAKFGPGNSEGGSALPARGGRAPPGPAPLLSNSCGAPAGPEPECPGRRTGRHCLQRPYHAIEGFREILRPKDRLIQGVSAPSFSAFGAACQPFCIACLGPLHSGLAQSITQACTRQKVSLAHRAWIPEVGEVCSAPPMLPCFQLLRIGGGRGGDLYTFHPPSGTGCTYRLGCRADLCDVALRPQQEPGFISGVHAELHAERQGDDWRVSLEDHSSQGTLVNNVRLPRGHRLELSDGDLLTFGPERSPETGPSEFYFMFQQVRVKPQDFAAITIPRSRVEEGTGVGFQPMLPPQGAPQRPLSTLSPAPKATLILNSIGSLSKLQPQPLTFSRSGGGPPSLPARTPLGKEGTTPSAPTPRNRRKSAHRVLAELDDEGEAPESPPVLREPRKRLCVETPSGNQRGHPPKHPVSTPVTPPVVGGGEPCAAPCCCLSQEETVAWVQCDGCDLWFHVACAGCSIQAAREADFRCPRCHMGVQT